MAEGMTVIPCHSILLSFSKTEVDAGGRRFDDIITIQEQLQALLSKFKTWGFCRFFQQWFRCWTCCLKLQENFSEGDSMK
jgi:hypothetical protein